MAGALFIAGNKRSGTSQLVRLLNLHPRVFVSHESDIIWILYQFHARKFFKPYPRDSARGMDDALARCGSVLDREKTPAENFFAFQERLMKAGSPWLAAMNKTDLAWVGDKKPFQHADPPLSGFIMENFPKARFIHIIRHPFSVAASAAAFNQTRDGDFWKGLTLEETVLEWAKNEKNVQRLKETPGTQVLDLRYEDMCRDTGKELVRVFDFLGLEVDTRILKQASRQTTEVEKEVPDIGYDEETLTIMKQYGYEPRHTATALGRAARNVFRALGKTF